jgi:hypothetical protein
MKGDGLHLLQDTILGLACEQSRTTVIGAANPLLIIQFFPSSSQIIFPGYKYFLFTLFSHYVSVWQTFHTLSRLVPQASGLQRRGRGKPTTCNL